MGYLFSTSPSQRVEHVEDGPWIFAGEMHEDGQRAGRGIDRGLSPLGGSQSHSSVEGVACGRWSETPLGRVSGGVGGSLTIHSAFLVVSRCVYSADSQQNSD